MSSDSSAKILLSPAQPREELRASSDGVEGRRYFAALAELAAQRKLDVQGEIVKRAGTGVTLQADEQEAKDKIEGAFRTAGLAVPSVKEVLSGLAVEARRAEKLLHILLREKNLMRVSPELIFHHAALAHLKEQLWTLQKSKGESISVSGLRT